MEKVPETINKKINLKNIFLIVGAIIIFAGISYGAYYGYGLYKKLEKTRVDLSACALDLQNKVKQLENDLLASQQENANTASILADTQKFNADLQDQQTINEERIDLLTKLTTIDPEFLMKYSKIYFLNENYIPENLTDINSLYAEDPAKKLQVIDKINPFLETMLKDANDQKINLRVQSAYRSFAEQKALKSMYKMTYGFGANKFSADQGYSEHQLGTTLDLTTVEIETSLISFSKTPALKWMNDNAYKYGFIMSYPKENKYYEYEPWHWRFVGRELASYLHANGKYFYELDQRLIDTFLVKIFD